MRGGNFFHRNALFFCQFFSALTRTVKKTIMRSDEYKETKMPVNLGTQYYRPPFPESKYWEDDFARIRDSGLNTVQLWVLWGWVEPKPGEFCFEDYDRLVELADKNGLGVVLSSIAEIQPYWIHREVPGSEMVDHMGHKVISSNRAECHFGITPGGCTDHPGVWERMARFLTELVTRYRGAANLRGWDAWNELRWNVHADGFVCYCAHTLTAFRGWLDEKYGGLEGLNKAWKRRYGSFEDVMPGKAVSRPYTEMMAFEHFITARANRHAQARYELMKSLDAARPVTVHGAGPCVLKAGSLEFFDQAINRGNDWDYADALDGVGCSSFPTWGKRDDADFAIRMEFVRSAARGKRMWLSELQGGRASIGFDISAPVDAVSQQRWVWNGLACGADTILFWCWRDEVFGKESSGFGLAGDDGNADERLAAMKITGGLLDAQAELLDAYEPAEPEVGVFFSPQSYYLVWAQEGTALRCMDALKGYARALARKSIPFRIVEEAHLDSLKGLKILFMPRVLVTDDATEKALADFVQGGGTIVAESETGAFNSAGLYRYPADRFTARLTGACEVGRRHLAADTVDAKFAGEHLRLGVVQWLTPWRAGEGTVLAEGADGALLLEAPAGAGRVILGASYFGNAYLTHWTADFERFVEFACRGAGWEPAVEVRTPVPNKDHFCYVKHGESGGKKVVFVFFPKDHEKARLVFRRGFFGARELLDLVSGEYAAVTDTEAGQECTLSAPAWRLRVLVES